MNFNQLVNKPGVRRRAAYVKALDKVDSDLEAETEPNRPGRVQFSQAGPSALAVDDAKQRRFNRIKEAERAKRKKKVMDQYGQDV